MVESGIKLLYQQFKALLWKNVLLSWRHKTATCLQLFSSFVFIFLMFIVQKSIDSRYTTSTYFQRLVDPPALVFPPIPPCEEKFFVKLPCYDFVWSGNSSPRISGIVDRILTNNPGRPIPPGKVRSFPTADDVDLWFMDNPMVCPGALHFVERNATIISYGVQTNSTSVPQRGDRENPTLKFQLPLQIAAEREIGRTLLGVDNTFGWSVEFKEFAHPPADPFSAVGTIGPTFFLSVAMFGFVFQMNSLVMEKELKLRQAMEMMGLYETAHWLSWLAWETIVVLISSLFIVLFGMLFRFDFFLHNNFAVLFFTFFLFQLNMTSAAFMLSTFISKSMSTTTLGFYTFIVGIITQTVTLFGFPYSTSFSSTARFIWSFFPPNLLAEAINLLQTATSTHEDPGVSWSGRLKCTPGDTDCVVTINKLYIWFISTFFLWFFLAIYFDNIISNPYGVRKSIFYFLRPGYWTGKGGNEVEGGLCSCMSSAPLVEHITPDDEDVLEEENNVKRQSTEGVVDSNVAVQIRGVAKIYPGTTQIGCGKCKRSPPYHALKGIWVNFPKDELFCLLGPNGAGKTTIINCLTGIMPVTAGDALVYGNSIRSSIGMSNIRRIIGVCPQFDILWDALNGEEHLYIFASIKGLSPASITQMVKDSLEEVQLTEAATIRASSYSGGMKRRLSVAIALIGDPKLIILDEPTTGMDPISRRHVWDIIERAKRGRAIVLTTHSMEEADILSDRIGIMAKGRLRCIGTSIRLKSRFGSGFVTNISFVGNMNGTPYNGDATNTNYQEAVKEFFKSKLDAAPKEENKSFLTFVIPNAKEDLLADFFSELQDREDEFGIMDIQLGLTTLEEVFLNIATQAELDSAAAEGRMVTLTLTTSGTSLQIPVGAQFIGIPGTESAENPTGMMVEVYWQQDDTGTLCISGHSQEMPTPPNVQIAASTGGAPRRGILGRRKQVHGFVIHPQQISRSASVRSI